MTTEDTQRTRNTERFPEEITDALDVLGETQNREVLADLCDTTLRETSQSETRINSLDALVRAGLARKQVESHTESTINARYELSEYGERFVNQLFQTLGSLNTDSQNSVE